MMVGSESLAYSKSRNNLLMMRAPLSKTIENFPMPRNWEQSGIVILQTKGGSGKQRRSAIKEYVVQFDELLLGLKILFGSHGPSKYRRYRQDSEQAGVWEWGSGGNETWTVEKLKERYITPHPPVYEMESEFEQPNLELPGNVEDDEIHAALEDTLFRDGKTPYKLHKPNSRQVETAKFIVHKYIVGHSLFSSLCSVLHWNLGHQNAMTTITAYLETVIPALLLTGSFPPMNETGRTFPSSGWCHILSMDHLSSLFNPEDNPAFYQGYTLINQGRTVTMNDILWEGLNDPVQLLLGSHCGVRRSSERSPSSIDQVIFLDLDLELGVLEQARYRTCYRSKASGTKWWRFDMQSTVQPFQLVGQDDSRLWTNAVVAYLFSAPRLESPTRKVINAAISLRFRTKICRQLVSLNATGPLLLQHANENVSRNNSDIANSGINVDEESCDEDSLPVPPVESEMDPAMDTPCRFIQDGTLELH
jgi:hypothetical protein